MAPSREALENLERRVEELQKSNDELQKENKTLSKRVGAIQDFHRIVKILSGSLGVTGLVIAGFLWQALTTSKAASDSATKASTTADAAVKAVAGLTDTLKATAAAAVNAEVTKQVPLGIDTRYWELIGSTEIAFGANEWKDYRSTDGKINHECGQGAVAVAWHWGDRKDVALTCKPITLAKRK